MVLPQHLDLAALRLVRPAHEEEDELDAERSAHDGDGDDVEGVGVFAGDECARGFDDDDEVDRAHQEACAAERQRVAEQRDAGERQREDEQ